MSEAERNKLLLIFLAEMSMLCEGFDIVSRAKDRLIGVLKETEKRRKIELIIVDLKDAVACFLRVDDQWISVENLESVKIPDLVSAPYVLKQQGGV